MQNANNMITPADTWLSLMNKKYTNIWAELKKRREDINYEIRKNTDWQCFENLPEWAEMPTLFPFYVINTTKDKAIVNAATSQFSAETNHPRYGTTLPQLQCLLIDELMSLSSLYLWRKSKGVYRFAPELYKELTKQPMDYDLHMESLFQLPEWAVYIETPGMLYEGRKMRGFIAHLDYALIREEPSNKHIDLQFAIFLENVNQPVMLALPFGNGTVKSAIERMAQIDREQMEKSKQIYGTDRVALREPPMEERIRTFAPMINLLMYLCSEEPDIQRKTPENQRKERHHKRSTGMPSGEHREWEVGARISYVIKKYKETHSNNNDEAHGTSAPKRPHIRSAHWHSYWVGPREETYPKRKIIVKWLPPIPVGVNWKEELPTNIKIVKG